MAVDLSIIIVSWNVAPLLGHCLLSITSSPGAHFGEDGALYLGQRHVEVYVVDNASSDGSPQMVHEEFPWVKLISNHANLGFTAGNNIALRACQGRYLLLLNPDTRLVADALETMLTYLEAHPQVGLLGPQLRYADGTPQSSRRRFPTLMTAIMESTLLGQWFPHNRWARRYHLADMADDAIQEVDWVTGACLLTRREVLEQVGPLDEAFFMYSEELDWCRRIKTAGWRIVFLPTATVMHYEGQSSGQVVAARHIYFDSSKVLYFRKHHSTLQADLLRYYLLATYSVRLAEEGLKYLLGSKRPLRRERLRAYRQVLRSGLRPPQRTPEGDVHV